MTDYPREQIMDMAEKTLELHNGKAKVYFKFTCEKCGERCMFSEPNVLYEFGECHVCKHNTKVNKAGYLLYVQNN